MRKPDLDPRVRIPLPYDCLVEHGVIVAGGISGDQAGRDAGASEHQRGRGRELLAVAGLDVEEKPVHRVAPWRHVSELERVPVGLLQVARERHHLAVLAGRLLDHLVREILGSAGQRMRIQVDIHG